MLNARETFECDAHGIPVLGVERYELPSKFVGWPNRKRAVGSDGVHFFCDDYRFEPVWSNVDRYMQHLEGRVVTSPDFSLYPEWPQAVQRWQVYRSRWMVAALRSRGARCIPSVSWSDASSFAYAFLGLPTDGDVAISAYGATRFEAAYRAGYEAMLEAVRPERVIVIGGVCPSWLTATQYYESGVFDGR